jgi:hypothetical protein
MPFLYLPDAVSLILLLTALTLLRSAASEHLRQELQTLRMDLLECCDNNSTPPVTLACFHLNRQIHSALESAERMSPVQVMPLARTLSSAPEIDCNDLLPSWMFGLESLLHRVGDKGTRERLRKVQMQVNMNLGVFYLFASVSGWLLTIRTLFLLMRRASSRRSKDRIDWLFDTMERLLIRHGRRAHQLALLAAGSSKIAEG